MKILKPVIFVLFVAAALLITRNIYLGGHAYTLSDNGGMEKDEQIQPLSDKITVTGSCDTEVLFTDVESGERYRIGYLTQGMSESITLEKGKWYSVEGAGELTMKPVNVWIE